MDSIEQRFLNSLKNGQRITARVSRIVKGKPHWQSWSEYELFYIERNESKVLSVDIEGMRITVDDMEYCTDHNGNTYIISDILGVTIQIKVPPEIIT